VRVSIIVPVLNEAPIIVGFLRHLRGVAPEAEIIVVDGGSHDGTAELCQHIADYFITTPPGRAKQMNAGTKIATGEVFWFVHADSRVAPNALSAIIDALRDGMVAGGCFRLRIVPRRWIYFLRDALGNVCVDLFRIALGDRGFFARRENFFAVGGYPECPLLEDAEFYRHLQTTGGVRQLRPVIETSARRYEALGPFRTSIFYSFIMALYWCGVPIKALEKMVRWFSSRPPSPGNANIAASATVLRS